MKDLYYELVKMHRHVRETHQTATKWRVGHGALMDLRAWFSQQDSTLRQTGSLNFEIMGIPVEVDDAIPEYRVALMAGENTTGASSTRQEQNKTKP